ncbi:MAG: NAD(P)H-hydrate dehydratase [Burkholderiaceae bacterium]|jgi:hydroxyethylthiazole kinase-like uncharacterized protein yjeF|nr:NAD(P)H-hydrate dehydratase [Burkholderiaceae bacterium]
MLRIPSFPTRPWPLFDTAATRELERQAAARRPAHALMQRAGQSLARLALALAPHARTVWIACGPGNNGGDGLQAAAWLRQWMDAAPPGTCNCRVLVTCTRERSHMPADAQAAWDQARQAGVQWIEAMPEGMDAQDLCVDALLGIGLRLPNDALRPQDPRLMDCLRSLQSTHCPVLCADIASGLAADTGQYLPPFAPPPGAAPGGTRHTLALLTLQPGLFTGAGRDACGQVWWDDLGTGLASGSEPDHATPCAQLFAPTAVHARPHASHKGSYGDVAILGGEGLALRGMSMAGAAWLAALAALHGGAGRVMLSLLDDADASSATAPWPEIMLRHPQAQDWHSATVVCGCGGGQAVQAWMARILEQAPRLVLDADGLNAVARDPQLALSLRERNGRRQATVLTPHPLEAARLLGCSTAEVQADRLQAARELALRFQCTALLKGSGTVVTQTPDTAKAAVPQPCWINPTGNARLATGGTGDVLAGLIAALWAQGRTPTEAAALAAYRHGAVADQWPSALPFSASALALQLGQPLPKSAQGQLTPVGGRED